MPFVPLSPSSAGGEEALSPMMPLPLVVAVLDSEDEKEGRTCAIVAFGFRYIHPASGAQVDVPEGYVTDFASIPAPVRGLFPPFGRHAKAAVLHDWLYLIGEPGQRAFADRIFLDAMDDLRVSLVRRSIMHRAVRLAGGGAYAKEASTWARAFGNWRTGDRHTPPFTAESRYQAHWPVPPRPDFRP
ncbi:DUF1353 domain-containing protein [Caulobacter vibrioides]|nr:MULTISPECIES: DUF1353 domain-containing protein [Caulobacter]YP_002515955.3 conserved hypothetical protein [Caulobacter vibrioides NA1000]ACL94047.3 conserved hypothetical protein [Caulobacter vibrioides NA1000]ATC23551.1 DUF1353 domain-containing protein [Caulobacter vibrioides]ATC27394.1 DUF1353 domain-containing protein [Caulobacter vibrioides]AZH11773.1 DUF1353 domain-containing protein [Caulobacter vibrioides]MCY1646598.1 DUF1353 domain-containing protein [Caulobacter sp. SL161]